MTIYVVTSGDYSDYRIRAVFTVWEKARRYVKIFNLAHDGFDTVDIEEFAADSIEISGVWYRVCRLARDGKVHCTIDSGSDGAEDEAVRKISTWTGDFIMTNVFSQTAEKAQKIALDRFTQFEAIEAGV